MDNMIDHPEHYRKPGRKECIDEMLEKFGPVAVYWFSVLSAYKYRYRAGDKPDNAVEQDEAKAEWYDCKAEDMRLVGAPDGWIRCSDRMPRNYDTVLLAILSKNGYDEPAYYVTIGCVKNKTEFDCYVGDICDGEKVTHWMPLPNPPEDGKV